MQTPRGSQRAAAIAAGAGQHHHVLATRVAIEKARARHVCQISPGILRHLNQFDLVILGHRAINLDHLRGGQGR
jgi:hypothetical protein